MRIYKAAFVTLVSAGWLGCAGTVPKELADARESYKRAQSGPAAQLAPVQLHEATLAMRNAEKQYEEDGDNVVSRDLAYVADRKARIAETQASVEAANREREQAKQELTQLKTQQHQQTASEAQRLRGELATAQRDLSQTQQEMSGKLSEAEREAQEARSKLQELASVSDDERGMVITIPGSVLFASGKWQLQPAAQDKLDRVAEALIGTKSSNLIIEGHTDAVGSDNANESLARRRAEAVRDYLVSRGVASHRVDIRGIGEARPIASNDTPEGRATNRRVEIVVERQSAAQR